MATERLNELYDRFLVPVQEYIPQGYDLFTGRYSTEAQLKRVDAIRLALTNGEVTREEYRLLVLEEVRRGKENSAWLEERRRKWIMLYLSPELVRVLEINKKTGKMEPKEGSPIHLLEEWDKIQRSIREAEEKGIKI